VGSSDGWDYQQHAAWYFEAVRHGWSRLERIFDHRTSADGLIATFERLATGEIAPTKVLVEYRP
jgi:alcohol dehydrogenase